MLLTDTGGVVAVTDDRVAVEADGDGITDTDVVRGIVKCGCGAGGADRVIAFVELESAGGAVVAVPGGK